MKENMNKLDSLKKQTSPRPPLQNTSTRVKTPHAKHDPHSRKHDRGSFCEQEPGKWDTQAASLTCGLGRSQSLDTFSPQAGSRTSHMAGGQLGSALAARAREPHLSKLPAVALPRQSCSVTLADRGVMFVQVTDLFAIAND